MPEINCKPLPTIKPSDIERFWRKVDRTPGLGPKGECWEWTGALSQGYGAMMFYPPRKVQRATRVAFLIQNGRDPFPLLILHLCNNRKCVRGSHLKTGTQLENMADAITDGIFRKNARPAKQKPPRIYNYAAPTSSMPALSADRIGKFLDKIDRHKGHGPNGDCHEWMGDLNRGSARTRINGKGYQAARIAYFIEYGVDPGPLYVLHFCDNKACCRKEHLSLGTMLDNMNDMHRKDRHAKGDTHGRRTLSRNIALEAKRRYEAGESQQSIADSYSVHKMTINLAIRGKTFAQ